MSDKATAHFQQMNAEQLATAIAESTGWNPKDGDSVDGVVISIKAAFSEVKNATYPIVFIMDDDGSVTAVHCFQTVLENEMKAQRPKQGEEIFVKRIGTDPDAKPKPGQSAPIRYAVHVKRDSASDDPWERM